MVEKINVKSHTRKTPSGSTKVESHTRLVDTEVKDAMAKMKAKEESQRISEMSSQKLWNDKSIKAEKLGSGKFSTFYKKGDRYFLETSDVTKELYTPFNRGEEKYEFFPSFDYELDTEYKESSDGFQKKVYEIEKYEPISAKQHPEQWSQLKEIKKAIEESREFRGNRYDAPSTLNNFVDKIENSKLPENLREEIVSVTNDAMNYGNIDLEISPRNVKINPENNNLILNDIFYDRDRI